MYPETSFEEDLPLCRGYTQRSKLHWPGRLVAWRQTIIYLTKSDTRPHKENWLEKFWHVILLNTNGGSSQHLKLALEIWSSIFFFKLEYQLLMSVENTQLSQAPSPYSSNKLILLESMNHPIKSTFKKFTNVNYILSFIFFFSIWNKILMAK